MEKVTPKKYLGQHFLKDKNIAAQITSLLSGFGNYATVLEIGAGMGVLTQFLAKEPRFKTFVIDIDTESIQYLKHHKILPEAQIITGDFLDFDLKTYFEQPIALIGNLPYNISSPILFRLLENRDLIPEMVCMLQKEVAERIAAPHGSKTYGILSVFLQAFYTVRYEFTVDESVFQPPPNVKSAVLSLRRNQTQHLDCDEKAFFRVVKAGFNQRRKMLRNGLKALGLPAEKFEDPIFDKRAEQLSVDDFVGITKMLGYPYVEK